MSRNDEPPKDNDELEAFFDTLYEQFPASMTEQEKYDLGMWVVKHIHESYKQGYAAGKSDEGLAREYHQ